MARTIAIRRGTARRAPAPFAQYALPTQSEDFRRHLLWLIACRGLIYFLGLSLADPLGILPRHLGPFPFAPLFNALAVTLTAAYLVLWRSRWRLSVQLYVQIVVDVCLTTLLVAHTRGVESAFVSFYLLIIIYSSLALGKNGGMIGATLSAIAYAGLITAGHLQLLPLPETRTTLEGLAFRISLHALGFFAVVLLGNHLSHRLGAMQQELEEKNDSLRQLQSLNEHIVSSIRSGLITTDLRGKIAVFNSTAVEITGRDSKEILESSLQSVLGEDLWLKILNADLLRDFRPLRHEAWFSLPGKSRRYLGFSVSPLLDQEVQLLGYIVSFQDLTDIKLLEEEVRLKDRMAAIGRMAAGIAHEIRNPLTSMRGSVEVLRSRGNLPESDARLLDILIRESDRLNKFVDGFLLFARPGKYTLEPVEIVSFIRDTSTLLQHSPEVRDKHRIETNLESPEITVLGNSNQLQQVFWNLAQNALRAMPTGGTLTIHAKKMVDGGAQIIFEDTGIGMTPEEKEQLFQPFQPGFAVGTGLGLSIVFQIVEDHRGKITFESEKGRGTKVILNLPLEPPAA